MSLRVTYHLVDSLALTHTLIHEHIQIITKCLSFTAPIHVYRSWMWNKSTHSGLVTTRGLLCITVIIGSWGKKHTSSFYWRSYTLRRGRMLDNYPWTLLWCKCCAKEDILRDILTQKSTSLCPLSMDYFTMEKPHGTGRWAETVIADVAHEGYYWYGSGKID